MHAGLDAARRGEMSGSEPTLARIEEMEAIYDGIARRARAELGITAWGMQVMTLPANWDGYPDHAHNSRTEEAGPEEVYVPLAGSGVLFACGEPFVLGG